MKKFLSLLLLATLLLTFCACTSAAPKAFSSNGMTITLTSGFTETTQEGYTACYDSKDVAVFTLKEAFTGQLITVDGASGNIKKDKDLTLNEYAKVVRTANISKNPSATKQEDGLTYFEYTFLNEQLNKTYSYFCVMYKASDAFWLVQFACLEGKYETLRPSFVEWAKTVSFEA